MNGFIKIHRKICESDVMSDEGTFHTFVMILMKVNWKRGRFRGRTIRPGQMVFSWRNLPERIQSGSGVQVSINTLRKRLNDLVEIGVIELETSKGLGTILTVKNWSKYQGAGVSKSDTDSPEGVAETDTHLDTHADTHVDTDRRRERKRRTSSSRNYRFDDGDLHLAKHLLERVLRVAPKTQKPNLESWANTIRLMRERDGHTLAEIRHVFDWANADNFWSTNILSPSKLRMQFGTLHAKSGDVRNQRSSSPPDRTADVARRKAEIAAKRKAERQESAA